MKSYSSLKELIDKLEEKYATSNIPMVVSGVLGGGSIGAWLEGNYKAAIIEGLISTGLLVYGLKKRNEYKELKNELTENYDLIVKSEKEVLENKTKI